MILISPSSSIHNIDCCTSTRFTNFTTVAEQLSLPSVAINIGLLVQDI